MRGIQSEMQRGGYLPMLMDAQTHRKLFDSYLKMVLERRAEAVIVIASWIFEEANLLADMEKNNVPIVIVGRDLTSRGIPSIAVDNEEGGALAMRHLLELGHRDIAVVRGPVEMFDSEPRWNGARHVAAQMGITIDSQLIFQLPDLVGPDSGFEGGASLAKAMLATGRKFSAVLAFDDLTALGVVRGLSESGLRVPQDCTVVGFDDVLPASVATPGISTIRQPLAEMGSIAAQWVLKAIESGQSAPANPPEVHWAQPQLVIRGSSAPLHGTE